jgi:hypothetical protein
MALAVTLAAGAAQFVAALVGDPALLRPIRALGIARRGRARLPG